MKVVISGSEYEAAKWDGVHTEAVKKFCKSAEKCPFCDKEMGDHGMLPATQETVCPGDFLVETEDGLVVVDPTFVEAMGDGVQPV